MHTNILHRQRKTAVVTGATGGLGQNLIPLLLQNNYDVVVVGRNVSHLKKMQLQFGEPIKTRVCDFMIPSEIHCLCDDIGKQFNQVDLLIHCAGIIYPGPFEEQSEKTILDQIQVNLTATILITKGLIPLFRKGSSIIFVNSLGGILPMKNSALYSASKFGLRGFALALALELRPRKIFVSSILPAAIDTPMLKQEIEFGGSVLNFCSPPLSAKIVCRTIMKAIKQKRLEYYLPKSSAAQIKLLMLKPSLLRHILPFLERIGKKGQKIWQSKHTK